MIRGEVFAIYVAFVFAEDVSSAPQANGSPAIDRGAISIWVAAREIEVFAEANGLDLG